MSGFAVIQANYPDFDIASVHETWEAAIEARVFGQWVEPVPEPSDGQKQTQNVGE